MGKSDSIIEKVFRTSLVSMTAAVVVTMLGIVIDGIVIGRFLGPECMAAYGLTAPVTSLVTALSGLMTEGTQVMCALNLGKGDVKRARGIFSVCMAFTLLVSVVLVACVLLFTPDISALLGARGESAHLQALVADYLRGLAISFPATIFLFEFNSLMRLDGDSMRVVVAVLTMTVLDIVGDFLNALVIGGGHVRHGAGNDHQLPRGARHHAAAFHKARHPVQVLNRGPEARRLEEHLGVRLSVGCG